MQSEKRSDVHRKTAIAVTLPKADSCDHLISVHPTYVIRVQVPLDPYRQAALLNPVSI